MFAVLSILLSVISLNAAAKYREYDFFVKLNDCHRLTLFKSKHLFYFRRSISNKPFCREFKFALFLDVVTHIWLHNDDLYDEFNHLFFFVFFKFDFRYLAESLPRCHQGDTSCLVTTINQYIQSYKDGRRDINLVGIDPLHVDEVDIIQGSNSPVNINLNFKDVSFYGLSNMKVHNVV